MTLHSPEFETRLKAACTAAIAESPDLQRRTLRPLRWHERWSIFPFVRPLFSALMGYGVWLMAKETGHLRSALAVITLTGFLLACMKAARLLEQLYKASDLPILFVLPASDDTIFRWESRGYHWRSLGSLLDFVVAYGVLGFYYGLPPVAFAGVFVIAVFTWGLVMALSIMGAAYLPKVPYWIAGVAFIALGLGVLYSESFRQGVVSVIDAKALWINALFPSGYAVWLFDLLTPPADWWHLAMLAPIATLLWIGKGALAHLRANYRSPQIDIEQARHWDPRGELEEELYDAPSADAGMLNLRPSEIEEHISRREFLEPPTWHTWGLFERLLWKWLTPRERVLAEFAFPEGIEIGGSWVIALKTFACTCLAWSATGLLFPTLALWLLGIGLFITVCMALGLTGGGRAFDVAQVSGAIIARHSLYAIGYRELGHVLFKHAAVQIPMLMAFTISASALLAYAARWPMEPTLIFGVKAGGALFSGTFVVAMFGFSGNSTDSVLRWRNLGFLSAVLLCGFAEIGLGLAAFLSKNPAIAWPCWALMIANAYLLFRVYGWFHDRNAFDSMRVARG